MYSVTVRWGADLNPDTDTEHSFDTEAELEAFLEGVDACSGWLDYEIVEETPET